MNRLDILRMAFGNFFRRRARSVLTIIGVVIGVAAIVIMFSLGIAQNINIETQMSQWGDLTVLTVSKGYGGGGGGVVYKESAVSIGTPGGSTTEVEFDLETIASFEEIPGVIAASPYKYESAKLVSGRYMCWASIIGLQSEKMELMGYEVEEGGRLLGEGDTFAIIAGREIPYNFYNYKKANPWAPDPNQPVGEDGRPLPYVSLTEDPIKLTFDQNFGEKGIPASEQPTLTKKPKMYDISIPGILKQSNENDWNCFMDYNTLVKLKKEYLKTTGATTGELKAADSFDQAKVKVASVNDVLPVLEEIKSRGYEVYSMLEAVEQMKQQALQSQILLGAIGGIALLVAAIGIANTMVMAIYERTREIGVMKVLGCRLSDLRTLFLTEAGIIGLFGGGVGLALSYGLSALMNIPGLFSGILNGFGGIYVDPSMAAKVSIIPPWLALLALSFAIVLALISGIAPAFRAMRLSALDAIKSEA